MNLIDFRNYCLSFECVTEKTPFGKFASRYDSILVFYTQGHMFCFVDIENFTFVNVRSTPEAIAELRDTYHAVQNPINQSLRYWIQLNFNGDIPDSMIMDLVRKAYDIVKAKYAPKKR